MHNRSVPTNSLVPHLSYQDVAAAIDWLTTAIGFAEHYRYGHLWLFMQHALDGAPDSSGATSSA
jgi:hypothetical protein